MTGARNLPGPAKGVLVVMVLAAIVAAFYGIEYAIANYGSESTVAIGVGGIIVLLVAASVANDYRPKNKPASGK